MLWRALRQVQFRIYGSMGSLRGDISKSYWREGGRPTEIPIFGVSLL